jgi:hypothetical protein
MVPGKETLGMLNAYLQDNYSITVSPTLIVDSFNINEVDPEMIELIDALDDFSKETVKQRSNKSIQATADSVRSSVAPATRRA